MGCEIRAALFLFSVSFPCRAHGVFFGFSLIGSPACTHAIRSASLWSWFILGSFSFPVTSVISSCVIFPSLPLQHFFSGFCNFLRTDIGKSASVVGSRICQ